MSSQTTSPLSVQQARALVADLMKPTPWVYWVDFLVSLAIGYGAAVCYLLAPSLSPLQIISFLVAGCALFRVALFMHEVVHFRRGEMTAFKVAWNILAGVPMLIPSFLYESHLAHHNTNQYGTGNDGEYLPLATGRWRNVMEFLGQIVLLPALVVFRFLILTPVSFIHPRLRRVVLERMSSYVINFGYRRHLSPREPRGWWVALELACFLRALMLGSLVFASEAHLFGQTIDLGWTRLPKLYLLAMFALGLNHVRTLVAHRYQSLGEKMTHSEQFDDSINVTGGTVLSELVFPVGLRYHALHHLFPSMPYHNLSAAHRRLLAQLPENSAYHRASYPTFWSALRALIASVRAAAASPPPPAEQWYARRRNENELPRVELATNALTSPGDDH